MEIINLTPHEINLAAPSGEILAVYPPSGVVARVSQSPGGEIRVPGVPVPVFTAPTVGAVTGLPEPRPGTLFLVSGFVAREVKGREDVFAPGTGPTDGPIRNAAGHVVAVTRLNAAG